MVCEPLLVDGNLFPEHGVGRLRSLDEETGRRGAGACQQTHRVRRYARRRDEDKPDRRRSRYLGGTQGRVRACVQTRMPCFGTYR